MEGYIKTKEEIEGIRVASKIAASVLEEIGKFVEPGVTTEFLDDICSEKIINAGATSASLGYNGFPKSVCISPNHVVCHGIPNEKKLKGGDIINIDVAVIKDGYYGDTSKMFLVGDINKLPAGKRVLANRIINLSYTALLAGIKAVKPGEDINVIGRAISNSLKGTEASSVREYCGHGVGVDYHEDLQILHFAQPDCGIKLEPGMVFTIEPMINAGKPNTRVLPDNWTVVTKDHSLSAQWEHTILVTEDGCEVLTRRKDESAFSLSGRPISAT